MPTKIGNKPTKKAKRKVRHPRPPGKLTGGEVNGFPVRRIKVADLHPADYNPREIRESALQGLKASVEEFGMPQAIVWNVRTRRIVGGHQRLKTLAPDAETDVIQVNLSEEQEKALNLAFNNPHIMGDWTEALGAMLDSIEKGLPELMGKLNLEDLRIEVPQLGDLAPPGDFQEVDENTVTTEHECPRCQYKF